MHSSTGDRPHDVVDMYIADSIKASAIEKRGQGIQRKVIGNNIVPTNWKGFLQDNSSKQELFDFLSNKIAAHKYPEGKEVFATKGQDVLTNGGNFRNAIM